MSDQSGAFSLLNAMDYFQSGRYLFVLIYATLLFDSLAIIIYGVGMLGIDFSEFLTLERALFVVAFLAILGITVSLLSRCLHRATQLIYGNIPISSLEKKHKDLIHIDLLRKASLVTENEFLMEYVEKEEKRKNTMFKSYMTMYAVLLGVILNVIITAIHNPNTITRFIFSLLVGREGSFIAVFIWILTLPVTIAVLAGILYSVLGHESRIYYPSDKYKILQEETSALLDKK